MSSPSAAGLCPLGRSAGAPGIAQTIARITDNIITENRGDVTDVLRQLEAAGMKQAMEAHPLHRTTV
ncbi:hypothetical protein ABZ383_06710 [Streptomyces sp. NPDC005900]|uniref:hypothetical protein n=1 Tax=Streptomyces sp. NPDC005900 TaxID=3154569 RepID=UPI0033DE99FB